jgi:pyruvate dehydrogenase E2 component (dihydrolipoamide acetyltransferase)
MPSGSEGAVTVAMPSLSEEAEEGQIVTWFAASGADVREGDLLAEVQVEKLSEEVRSPTAGIVRHLVERGGVVEQGAPIAVVEAFAAPRDLPDGEAEGASEPGSGAVPIGSAAQDAPTASPAARRVARELGVDLRDVREAGATGRIVEADVRAFTESRASTAGTAPAKAPGPEPATPMRRAIAGHLLRGLATTAQLTVTAEADVTELRTVLDLRSAQLPRKISYTGAVVRAVALALAKHPRVGAQWTDAGVVRREGADIGVAVALDDGLVTPVIRNADRKTIEAVDSEIVDLGDRARALKLTAQEMDGGSITVTNLGAYGIDAFTPLLNSPQSAILGIGAARERPAVVSGEIVPRSLVVLSLTFDHQILDGAPAAAFLRDVVRALESPGEL